MPTVLRMYSNNQPNTVLCQAIHFACRQFYILHRKPFVLQMFGSVAPILDMSCGADGVLDTSKVGVWLGGGGVWCGVGGGSVANGDGGVSLWRGVGVVGGVAQGRGRCQWLRWWWCVWREGVVVVWHRDGGSGSGRWWCVCVGGGGGRERGCWWLREMVVCVKRRGVGERWEGCVPLGGQLREMSVKRRREEMGGAGGGGLAEWHREGGSVSGSGRWWCVYVKGGGGTGKGGGCSERWWCRAKELPLQSQGKQGRAWSPLE